jgi:hypothetical protein
MAALTAGAARACLAMMGASSTSTTTTSSSSRSAPRLLLLLPLSLWLLLATAARAFPPDPLYPKELVQHLDVQPGLLRGFVDPTALPYGAKGDGVSDDAAILQRAVNDAYHARISLVLPAGRTFLLSRQLSFHQLNRSRAAGFQIFGGAGPVRPVLKLQDGAPAAAFPLREGHEEVYGHIFLLFQLNNARSPVVGQESEHYNSRFRGIDIDLGNNPTVSGLSMAGAQQCSIEDVQITGEAFRAGVVGLPGSGGFSANIAVVGGEYVVMQDSYRPNPSISGLMLKGQQKAGLRIDLSHGPTVVSNNPLPFSPSFSPALTYGQKAPRPGAVSEGRLGWVAGLWVLHRERSPAAADVQSRSVSQWHEAAAQRCDLAGCSLCCAACSCEEIEMATPGSGGGSLSSGGGNLGSSTRNGAQGQNSAFNGEDGLIVLHSSDLANSTAIESRDGSDVVLKNVYVRGARTLIYGRPAAWTWGNRQDGVAVTAVGQPSDWTNISSFVFSMSNGSIFDHRRIQVSSTPIPL